jgi:putative ABC transport system permease protein
MNKRLLLAGSVRILTRYKLRSFFMSLGIVVGVAALVVMRSMGSSAQEDMLNKIEKMFSAGSILLVNNANASRHGGFELGDLKIEDVEALVDQLPQVTDWDPMVLTTGEVRYRGRNRTQVLLGHSERAEFVWNRGVVNGDYFSKSDVRTAARVALIGSKTAKELFGDEDPIGKKIQFGNVPLKVKGVLEDQGFDPHGRDRDDEILVPFTTLMQRLSKRTTLNSAKLIVASPEEAEATVDELIEILRARHRLADNEEDDFAIYTATAVQRMVRDANRVLTVYLPATAGIALLVAAIVIANIMLIGVRERIPEIGLRKAVGATDRQIGGQFLLETLAVTVVSGVVGVGLGAAVLFGLGHINPTAKIAPDAIVMGFGAALVVGLLAGFLPARQAARQEPVDALR